MSGGGEGDEPGPIRREHSMPAAAVGRLSREDSYRGSVSPTVSSRQAAHSGIPRAGQPRASLSRTSSSKSLKGGGDSFTLPSLQPSASTHLHTSSTAEEDVPRSGSQRSPRKAKASRLPNLSGDPGLLKASSRATPKRTLLSGSNAGSGSRAGSRAGSRMGSRQDLRQVSDRASKKGKHAGSSRDSQTSSDEGEEDADDAEESVASSDDGDDLGSVSTFESDDQNRKEFLDEDQDNPLLATRHFHALMGTNLQEILETLGKEREEQTLEEERAISAGAARAKKSRGGGRHRRKLASKLSSSLADFLGAATGEFRGPGDVYRRFLISGLRKRGVAPPVSTVLGNGRRVHEDPGRSVAPNYLTVGPSPVELAVKSNKKARRSTVTSASYFQFESPAQRNNRKLALLHEIRIYIITKTHSLRALHDRVESLKEENKYLKLHHEKLFEEMNRRIGKMTIENEKMDGQLYKMQKERKKIRKDLKIAWDTFAKKSDSKVQTVNKHYKEVQNQYQEVELDLQDLQQFKELTNQGTEALVGRVKAEQEKKQALLLENERLMKDIKERIPAEDQEVSQDILRKVIDILETTQLRIASFVDDKTAEAFRKNQRIKNELVIHHNQQSRSLERIFELEAINSKIRLEHMKWDKEHDIKNFRSKMTCTPDMEFYFQS